MSSKVLVSIIRYEATLVNARLRKAHIHNETDVALIGTAVDLTYPYEHLGESTQVLEEINNGTHPYAETLKNAEVRHNGSRRASYLHQS